MHIPCVNKCLEYLRKTAIKYSKLFRPLCPHCKRDLIHWKDWYRFITCTPKSYDFPGLVYIPVHTYIMQYIPGTYIPDPTRAKQWLVEYLDITESYDGWLVGYMKITITDKKCWVSGYAPSLWRETIPLVQIRRCDSRFNNLNKFEILDVCLICRFEPGGHFMRRKLRSSDDRNDLADTGIPFESTCTHRLWLLIIPYYYH